jgi:hypothetical protein
MDVRGVQVHCGETQEGNKGNKKGEKAGVGKGTGRLMMALVARLIDGWCKLLIKSPHPPQQSQKVPKVGRGLKECRQNLTNGFSGG